MEVADEGANAGEVVGVEGNRIFRSSEIDWWMCVGMVFGAERVVPEFGAGGVLLAFE